MSAHTPGPWKTRKSPHGKRYLCVQIGKDENYTTLELEPADAVLIAAAPDLLESLEELFGASMETCMMWDGKDDQIAAIAKARAAMLRARSTTQEEGRGT